jgi:all-trans-8'-apo-beta-carotenal 15,15'-oxygenase
VANTSVVVWNGRLLALMEAGRPTELCPEQLFTLGETDLGGVVGGMFSAHPHRVPARRASYNFGMRILGGPGLDLYVLPDQGPARRLGFVPLEELSLVHDFIATENHLVFFLPPVRLRVLRLMAGGCFSDSLAWKPEEGTEVVVVPIDAPERVRRFTVEPFHVWHFANAFEQGGRLHVDYVRLPDFSSNALFRDLPRGVCGKSWDGHYHRAEIDLSRRTFRSRQRSEIPCDFPQLAPAALGGHQHFSYLGGWCQPGALGPPDSVLKLEPDTGKVARVFLGEAQIPSEPLFVPRASATHEDDGYLLTLVYDGLSHTSHVAVLDARVPEAGPLARVHFDQHIPLTFHGSFVPA